MWNCGWRRVVIVAAVVSSISGSVVAGADALPPTVTVAPLSLVEGAPFSGQIATYTDAAGKGPACFPASAYSVSVLWGDGSAADTPTPAFVSGPDQSNLCTYAVDGTHAYAEEGKDNLGVSVTGPSSASPGNGGASVPVADAALTAAGTAVDAVAGTSFSGTVATFSDADMAGVAADYTATIDWGDGTTTSGAVGPAAGGGFTVTGAHTWTTAGDVGIVVHVADAGGAATSAKGTAAVAAEKPACDASGAAPTAVLRVDPSLSEMGTTTTLDASASTAGASPIASYTFDFGDGAGLAQPGAATGHVYRQADSYRASVTVTDACGRTATAVQTAMVTLVPFPESEVAQVPPPKPPTVVIPPAGRRAFSTRPISASTLTLGPRMRGWGYTGNAFTDQPTVGDNVFARRALPVLPSVGGSYWDVPYPIGVGAAERWIGTADNRPSSGTPLGRLAGDGPTGVAFSPLIRVRRGFLGYEIGGSRVGRRERVELWAGSDAKHLVHIARDDRTPAIRCRAAGKPPTGGLSSLSCEALRGVTLDVRGLRGKVAQIRIHDDSPTGHVNVADIRTASTSGALHVPPAPLFGLVDTHTHPTMFQAFGGLTGIHTIFGSLGGTWTPGYATDTARLTDDLGHDDGTGHGGGVLAPIIINAAEGHLPIADLSSHLDDFTGDLFGGTVAHDINALFRDLLAFFHHDPAGPPTFSGWPSFMSGSHFQMHITEIRRAYDGGLRVMSALASSNATLQYMMSPVDGVDHDPATPSIPLTDEKTAIEAHVAEMRRIVGLNRDWMRIVETPAQLAAAVRENKLAVILGVEVNQLGSLFPEGGAPTDPPARIADREVDWLYRLGIRQVFPIFTVDNELGGAAIFEDVYNTTNDLLWRHMSSAGAPWRETLTRPQAGPPPLSPLGIGRAESYPYHPTFFGVKEGGCDNPASPLHGQRGYCVDYRMDPNQFVVGLDYNLILQGISPATHGWHPSAAQYQPYSEWGPGRHDDIDPHVPTRGPLDGMLNTRGLTPLGRAYVLALMRHGMLIDTDHLSDATFDDITRPGGPIWTDGGTRGCRPLAPPAPGHVYSISEIRANVACFHDAYPVMSSHTSFRYLSLQRDGTVVTGHSGDPGCDRDVCGSLAGTQSKNFVPKEFKRTPSQIAVVRLSGGMTGINVSQDPVDVEGVGITNHALTNTCGGSSKSYALTLDFAEQGSGYGGAATGSSGMGDPMFGPGSSSIAASTDFGFHPTMAPRFGRFACLPSQVDSNSHYGYQYDNFRFARAAHGDGSTAQTDPVRYTDSPDTGSGPYTADSTALAPFQLGTRQFDFNQDGLANYGLLPDLYQDVSNDGLTPQQMAPLFESAQGYEDMWSKAWRLARCATPGGAC